jgi:RNA polymerase sigma-54 factor
MNFANLAAELELHETTVGRLAAGRMMATPRGAVTLRALCSAAIATQDGGQVSAVALRHRIGGLIAQEGRRPLSDAQIAARLEADGILLARRTVAKYRAQLGISSAAERGANRDNGRVSSTHIA